MRERIEESKRSARKPRGIGNPPVFTAFGIQFRVTVQKIRPDKNQNKKSAFFLMSERTKSEGIKGTKNGG